MYELGRAYAANRQLPDAAAAYRKAADKGSTSAMVELGVLLANGTGVAKDEAQARALFQRAAEAGNPRGATNLAALSGNGGTPSDPVEARALLEKAAATNSAEGEFELGADAGERHRRPEGRRRRARLVCQGRRAKSRRGAWIGSARSRRPGEADRRIKMPPRPITSARWRSATTTPRPVSSA